jgi:serine/threonine-protein kinase
MGSNYSFSISVRKFWLMVFPSVIIVLAWGFILGFFLVDKVIMPQFTDLQNKNDVEVPSLVNVNVDVAAQTAFDLGLRIIRNEKEYSDNVPFNTIISQNPTAGEKVKKGRHISVVISNGAEVAVIPETQKLAEGPAKSTLRQAGFENITAIFKYDSQILPQSAIETEPSAGTKTSRDLPIKLYLSKGKRPTHATVPNLVGEMFSQVQATIEEKGLKLGRVRTEASSVMSAGQIISQSLTPGTDVPLESVIDVVVAAEK